MKLKRIDYCYWKESILISCVSISFSYVFKETQFEIQIQESFMNSQSIVNGSNLPWIWILWLKIHILPFISIEKRREAFRRCVFWDTIQYNQSKGINRIQSKKRFSNLLKREYFHLFCIVLAAWPSGKAGDCKSLFPSSNPGVAWSTKDSESLLPLI